MQMKKTGLVLSGGGVRGLAHLGILKVLDEQGIKFSAISGTSAGAIVGAFYSAGFKPDEILDIFRKTKFFGFSNLLFGKAGLFDMKTFESVYHTYFPGNRIEDLPIPLHITATDIVKGELCYFSSGNLAKALMASSCVPLVFQPVAHNDSIYLDGGILNNFPIEPLEGISDQIIGLHVNSISSKLDEIHMKDMLDRSFQLALRGQFNSKSARCSITFEPPGMSRFGLFDLSLADEIFDFSYQYAQTRVTELRALFEMA